MRLAASNIAWPQGRDAEMAAVLDQHGVSGVEVAPSKVWPRPLDATRRQLREYRGFWEDRGLPIVALQSLLFGRDDLTIFETEARRGDAAAYLRRIMDVAVALGAGVLVFGSPRNRRVGSRAEGDAAAIAGAFFGAMGEAAADRGLVFCIEPNPTAYACDFVNTALEGAALVRRVARPGFALHLDAGGLALNDEPGDAIAAALPLVRHFHISEPQLVPVGAGATPHRRYAEILRGAHYAHWVSLEMREPPDDPGLEHVRAAVRYARDVYGTAGRGASGVP